MCAALPNSRVALNQSIVLAANPIAKDCQK